MSQHVIIRFALEKDLPDILRLEAACLSGELWSESLIINSVKNKKVFVADNENVIGYIIWEEFPDGIEILRLGVDPFFRRNGIGKILCDELMRLYPNNEFRLEVRESNDNAQSFYEVLGFEMNGMRKNYYRDNGEAAIQYVKKPIH